MAEAAMAGTLRALGFTRRRVSRSSVGTTIAYLGPEIGVEIHLDWREIMIDIMLARLADGQLPGGYAVHEGKVVRVHLETVVGHFPRQSNSQKSPELRTHEQVMEAFRAWTAYYAKIIAAEGPTLSEKAKTYFASR